MGDNVLSTVGRIEEIGKKQHNEFREMRIFNKIVPFDDPIKKNKLSTFNASNTKGQSNKPESKNLKIHVRLFSEMYISTQTRGGSMLEFFNHETLQYPPALAKGGKMRSGRKSDLMKCILPDSTTSTINAQPKATGTVLEASVLVNLVKPKKNQSFKDYSPEVFYPQICKHKDLYRVDVVFDT